MPGSSLWLLPPDNHPLNDLLNSLIAQTSSHFSSPHLFIPHITLTSNISPSAYALDPQQWLDSLKLPPADRVSAKFGKLNSENVFVRKLYIRASKDGLKDIASSTRQSVEGYEEESKAREWADAEYTPHLSLLYHDCPIVPEEEMKKIETLVKDAGVSLEGQGELGGWTGGRVALVPTDRPIKEWVAIAERAL